MLPTIAALLCVALTLGATSGNVTQVGAHLTTPPWLIRAPFLANFQSNLTFFFLLPLFCCFVWEVVQEAVQHSSLYSKSKHKPLLPQNRKHKAQGTLHVLFAVEQAVSARIPSWSLSTHLLIDLLCNLRGWLPWLPWLPCLPWLPYIW
jgi:hypothetical protein